MQVENFPKLRPMGEDLRHQRRSLIRMSLLLCFMKYAGVTISKVSIFGADIHLINPLGLYIFIWLIWGYFLWRYYSYFWQEGLPISKLAIQEAKEKMCSPKLEELIFKKNRAVRLAGTKFNYNLMERSNSYTLRFSDHLTGKDPMGAPTTTPVLILIKIWSLWKELLRSYYQVIIKQSVGTDYYFPFIFALFVFYYCNYGDWQGNLFNIFFFNLPPPS